MERKEQISLVFGIVLGLAVFVRIIVTKSLDAFSIVGITIALLPFFLIRYIELRELRVVEKEFPNFLRDIASSTKAGMTLPYAIKSATYLDYSYLSSDVKKIYSQISWGIPFEEAILQFSKRRPSKHIQRSSSIVIEANRAGGEITKTLDAVANFSRMMQEMEEELKGSMKTYTIIIYFSHMIFLGILIMLIKSLLEGISGLTGIMHMSNLGSFKELLFHMALIQGGFTGLVAGKIGEGSIYDGLKHSIVLILISYLVFKIGVGI